MNEIDITSKQGQIHALYVLLPTSPIAIMAFSELDDLGDSWAIRPLPQVLGPKQA